MASPFENGTPETGDARGRIIAAAAALLASGGREALTTRAVAAAARVQAPTIYRLFGDKQGLLNAAAEHGLATYVADKAARAPHPDPLKDFRDGWDLHVAFGVENPALFAIISGGPRDSDAARAGMAVLRRRIRALAAAGLLRVPEERAVALVHATGIGTVLTLLEQAEETRDPGLAAAAREAVIAATVGAPPAAAAETTPQAAAITLGARLDAVAVLSPGERHLLAELLDRIAAAP